MPIDYDHLTRNLHIYRELYLTPDFSLIFNYEKQTKICTASISSGERKKRSKFFFSFYKNVRFNWRRKIALLQYVRFNVRRDLIDVRVWLLWFVDDDEDGFFIGVDEAGGINFVFGVEVISMKNSNWSWLSIGRRRLYEIQTSIRWQEEEVRCLTYVLLLSMSSSCIAHMNVEWMFCRFSRWVESIERKWMKTIVLHAFISLPLSLCLSLSLLCIIICSSLTHSFTHFIEACR